MRVSIIRKVPSFFFFWSGKIHMGQDESSGMENFFHMRCVKSIIKKKKKNCNSVE